VFKTSLKKTTDPISQMRADIDGARAALEAAENEFGSAVLDAAGKPDDAAAARRCQTARTALTAARDRLASLQGALAAVEKTGDARAASAAAKAAADALTARWATAEAQGKVRAKAAKAVEAAGVALGQAWRDVEAATASIAGTQLAYDPDGALLLTNDVQRTLLHGVAKASGLHLLARGVPDYLLNELPTLSSRIEAANAHLQKQKVG
jgi:hypothetical protein